MTSEGVDPMGRGRARAKQTKVARDLKYRSVNTDFESLEKELRGDHESDEPVDIDDQQQASDDPYADLAAKYADYDDDVRKTS